MTGRDRERGRWERLAFDLEAQAASWEIAERAGEIAERQRIEDGRMRLADRLRWIEGRGDGSGNGDAARGAVALSAVVLTCAGGVRIRGAIVRVVSDALIVAEDGGREALVSLAMVLSATGLSRLAVDPDTAGVVESRIGLRHLIRSVVRDRSAVRVHLADGSVLDGTLDRVGADFVELAVHAAGEARRRDAVRHTALVALGALVAIRRDGE
ncbi:MAG: uncharacterized protein JWN61_1868 [Pseudonocardiales bacterium]|nr:uncharacterized protein [Pseudonocardiales bacterium]